MRTLNVFGFILGLVTGLLLMVAPPASAGVYTRTFGTVAATASVTSDPVNIIRASAVSVCWAFDPAATSGNVTCGIETSIDKINWSVFGSASVAVTGPFVIVPRSILVSGIGAGTTVAFGVPAPWIRLTLTNSTTGANLTNVAVAVMDNASDGR